MMAITAPNCDDRQPEGVDQPGHDQSLDDKEHDNGERRARQAGHVACGVRLLCSAVNRFMPIPLCLLSLRLTEECRWA